MGYLWYNLSGDNMMKKIISLLPFVVIILLVIIFLGRNSSDDKFRGLNPIAVHNSYFVYDLVQQKALPCAEMIEVIGVSRGYEYYFNCLKSNQIYLVRDNVVIDVNEALDRNLIYLEDLYNYGIADRWEVEYE